MSTLYQLVEMGILKVSGNDAKKFLQGQLTCNLDEITPTESRMGAHCNPQGRIISLFHLFLFQNAYYLLMPKSLIDIAMSALKKYALFYKVEVSNISNEWNCLGISGHLPALPETIYCLATMDSTRHILIGKASEIANIAAQINKQAAAEHWKCLDIAQGIPHIYLETSGKFLPHEINLDKLNAVSFNKGCYTGQEIIARMHYRGKLKSHLYIGKLNNTHSLKPGEPIFCLQDNHARNVGTLVDACVNEQDEYQILLVTDKANAKNNHLFLEQMPTSFLTLTNLSE